MIEKLIEQLLKELGQDVNREGLEKTPERVAKALRYLTSGYDKDVKQVLNDAMFVEDYDEMVIVKDIDFFSLCVPSKQIVNAVDGAKPARAVRPGDRLWTLDQGYLKETTVTTVTSRRTREIVEVRTTGGRFKITPDHPVMTESGWVEAQDLRPGTNVEWINPKSLCRKPYELKPGYALGYVLGAVAADGSIQQGRRINLTVKSAAFAEKYRTMFTEAFPGAEPAIERVTVPSSFLRRDVPMFRVRTVSRAIGEKLCRWLGVSENGSRSKTASFQFPRVVTSSQEMMQGFLDGYCDGDGEEERRGTRRLFSSNRSFLQELGEYLEARVGDHGGDVGRIYVSSRWHQPGWRGKNGFRQDTEIYEHATRTYAQVIAE